ncbi:MAG: M56 family metallopeptidase, partial [Isosphaerales bacterium]
GRRPVNHPPPGGGGLGWGGETASLGKSVDWAGVFCHELAHWARRDQWSSLLGELLIAALPWHPLAWWARRRLGQLSELACDDWVLGTGLPAADYAESLLGLVPQRGAPLALAAVSSRRGLFGRIQHILDERRSSPIVGKRWACASGLAMVLAASALALAQSRPAVSKGQRAQKDETEKVIASKTDPVSNQAATKTRTIRGTVLGPDGKPFSGATVFWVGQRKPPVSFVAMPKDVGHSRLNKTDVIARAVSDSNGRFSLSADVDPDRYVRYNGWVINLLARAPRAGMVSEAVNADVTEVTLKLAPEVVIRGRLLTPSGMPAAGARVTLTGFTGFPEDKPRAGMHLGLTQTDDEIPPYWPQPRKTDADGRFTFEGVPSGAYAALAFWHPDFAVDEVTVNTTSDGAVPDGLRSFEIVPVSPDFTHALEPARPVQGRVTDKETGKPLAGMLVEVIPMRSHGGMPFQTRTDADGHYRVSGHQAERHYIMNVYPPADSGYLSQSGMKEGWPAGAKFIEKDYALEKGRIVHGQVTDAGTRQPIASAAVVYQPKRGNPNNTRGYEFRNTVLTDKDGRFAITTLAGQGFLAVETPDENYVRVLLRESYRGTVYPQGWAAIDVPKEGEPKPAAIEVRKGVTLEAKAIGPDGQVVREITGFCKGIDAKLIDRWDKAQPFEDGVFRLKGADPNKTYRVFFLQFKRRLGAVAELKFDPRAKGPIEVRLEPTARVHGAIVKPGGSPAMGGQVLPYVFLDKEQTELKSTDVFDREDALINVQLFPNEGWSNFFEKCRVQGKFQFEHLIAGARYGLSVRGGNLEGLATVPPLVPGENRDLGTITLKERQP